MLRRWNIPCGFGKFHPCFFLFLLCIVENKLHLSFSNAHVSTAICFLKWKFFDFSWKEGKLEFCFVCPSFVDWTYFIKGIVEEQFFCAEEEAKNK